MTGRSWRPGCPVGLDDLRLLTVSYWGFDGQPHAGNLVAHRDHAAPCWRVFHNLFDQHFPIERIQLVDDFGADDAAVHGRQQHQRLQLPGHRRPPGRVERAQLRLGRRHQPRPEPLGAGHPGRSSGRRPLRRPLRAGARA